MACSENDLFNPNVNRLYESEWQDVRTMYLALTLHKQHDRDASMKKLWKYEDYVNHLSDENKVVRRWAFKALENRFPNRYADEVSSLINDGDEFLASPALRYLVRHEAVQYAPAILATFKESRGMVAGNCASALAKMNYVPAIDVMLEHFFKPESEETLFNITNFLGEIHHDKCRDALQIAVSQLEETFLLGTAMANLLEHHRPEDIHLVLDKYFRSGGGNNIGDRITQNISAPFGGESYFSDLMPRNENNILAKPSETIDNFIFRNSHIKLDETIHGDMIKFLDNGRYQDLVAMILSDTRNIYHSRYPENDRHDNLRDTFGRDTICINFFEDLQKRASIWKQAHQSSQSSVNLISLILSAYFAMQARGAHIKALSPETNIDDLMEALKNTGPALPMQIRKKIKALSPISELKAALTEDLMTWGDIWTVRMMGQIGHKDFVPSLVHVLKNADSLDFIHGDAVEAMNAIDVSADETILTLIKNEELGDWESFAILEHLPYAEAYDLAVHRWENESDDGMDSYELFAACLKGIGDPRGIEKLQDIYANKNDAVHIGNDLECLARIHKVNIPELPSIIENRKEQEERQKARLKELNSTARAYSKKKTQGGLETTSTAVPYKRNAPKVGRNEPCPCGSGKKHKKCCLQ
jgi:SEC-C motif